ncbi:MAG: SDR family oxidoreductase [Rhodospirillales bacterium]|nr:SDR family oxidoreductase [Rhodospirillales bacterium]
MDTGTVLITGAAKRIGRALAEHLARDGWNVVIHYHRSADDAEAIAAAIRTTGGRAAVVAADLAVEDETAGLVDAAVRAAGSPLTAVINNASVFEDDGPETATRQSWDRHMEVNLRAPFVLCQAFCRQLPEGGRGSAAGAIVNVLDQRVWHLTPMFTSYTVSKVGLWALTQTLAMALAPRVRVNAVGPGPVLPSSRQSAEGFRRQWLATPLARQVDPEEIARAVHYLLTAPSVTGQMIAVDAGQHLGWSRALAALTPKE